MLRKTKVNSYPGIFYHPGEDYTPAETKTNREIWAKALCSGNFEKTIGYLGGPDGYCVMGVGCVVVLGDPQEVVPARDVISGMHEHYYWENEYTKLPEVVAKAFGVFPAGDFDDIMEEDGEERGGSLIDLNDETDYSFDQLADIILDPPDGMVVNS